MMACGLAVVSTGWGPQRYSRAADQGRGPIRARLERDSILDTNGCANGRIPAFSISNRGDLLYLVPKRNSAAGRGMVGVDIPSEIKRKFEIHEWRNSLAILSVAHPDEWKDIATVLRAFRLLRSHVLAPGGRKSRIANDLDGHFFHLGWVEKGFDTKITVDETIYETPTHKVDCYKNRVALEVEWNNKDPFFDRDLNNFRLLFELRAIDVGIIITRCSELQDIFDELGKGKSYGASTTHMNRLLPRIDGGGGGGCPIAVFGIRREAYVED